MRYQCRDCGAEITANARCQECRDRHYARWLDEVRDPAKETGVEPITLHAPEWADLRYQVARIPSGWAWRAEATPVSLERHAGVYWPWTAVDTEDEAHARALEMLSTHTGTPLQPGLFGGAA